jgi:methyltransferase-like protein/ubiquinone/menaquinone biosynthesis C-methylase UbiE
VRGMNETSVSYDEAAYPGFAYAQTHPDRLATLGRLFGIESAPIDHCRVLELGCGDGLNLIAMALQLPDSQFLGIDLAASAIAKGEQWIATLGLSNIQLHHQDILAFDCAPGSFDYILAHGLYSWVPPVVQKKLLELVQRGLAPNGIAYVSYNALPGGHFRLMLREMMQFHTRSLATAEEKVEQGKSLVRLLAHSTRSPNTYTALLLDQLEHNLVNRSTPLLIHDELGPFNENLYFHEFMSRAAQHGLQFLSEAEFIEMYPFDLEPHVAKFLDQFGDDVLAREQYIDFLKCRRFRQTLLCHRALPITREFPLARIAQLFYASTVQPTAPLFEPEVGSPVEFQGANQATMTTGHPLVKAALHCLERSWPLSLAFADLKEKALRHLASLAIDPSSYDSAADHRHLLTTLFLGFRAGILQLHSHAQRLAPRAGEFPEASRLARLQAGSHDDHVTTLLHTSVSLAGAMENKLLQLLDGTRDRNAIVMELELAIQSKELAPMGGSETGAEDGQLRSALVSWVEEQLLRLGRLGLLLA